MKDKENEEEMIRRKILVALLAASGLASAPKTWTTPLISTIVLPAHAQTSCMSILDVDVLGKWRFTDPNGLTFDLEFIDENTLNFSDEFGSGNLPWSRGPDGTLSLDLNSPRAPWFANISMEENCVASEIRIINLFNSAGAYETPIIGVRI